MRSLEHAAADRPTVSPSGRESRSGPLTSTEANSCTIQRAATDDSDPDLKDIYDDLVSRSETFHALDARLMESHGAIRLVDSMKLPGRLRGVADYVGRDHAIRAPASGAAPPVLRHNLMWEMHNALNRAEHERTGRVFAPHLPRSLGGPAMPSLEQASKQKYHVAARALAMEWDEWATLIEADLNALKVNFQLSGQGDAWRNAIDDNLNFVADNAGDPDSALHREVWTPYISSFSGTDRRSWRDFSNYLEKQLEMKHTAGYDMNARNTDWIGRQMLERVQAENPAALTINKSEIREFLDGRSGKVKPGSSNPFKNTDIAEQAADLDPAGSSTAASSANPFQSFAF